MTLRHMTASESSEDEFILSENATTATILGTGVLLGIVHVLSGPDHMAAIATLSAGNSWKAFRLGAQWGVGHSIGLVATAILFLSGVVELESFGKVGEPLVGVFMVLLAGYAFWDVKFNSNKTKTGEDETTGLENNEHIREHLELDQQLGFTNEVLPSTLPSADNDLAKETTNMETVEKEKSSPIKFSRWRRFLSLLVGIVHGVAGPGGVLGVVPAIVLDDTFKSSVYLASFCLASIFIMGLVACLFGQLTFKLGELGETNQQVKRIITREKLIKSMKILSGILSLVIGALWIGLSAAGKLDDIFE